MNQSLTVIELGSQVLPCRESTPLPLSRTVYALNLAITMLIGTALTSYMLPVLALGRHWSEYCAIRATAVRALQIRQYRSVGYIKTLELSGLLGFASETPYYATYDDIGPQTAYCDAMAIGTPCPGLLHGPRWCLLLFHGW